jgi:hypothetical protein
MNLDVGTLAGVLGVILTIIFFIVGYRQTIGASRERVRSSNKDIIDILLRRLILEPNFSITWEGLEEFLLGKALEAQIRPGDIVTLEHLSAILQARVIESDYISADRRREILERVKAWFKPPRSDTNFLPKPPKGAIEIKSEAILGVIASLAGAAFSVMSVAIITADGAASIVADEKFPIYAGVLLITLSTAVAMVLYVRIRDKASNTIDTDSVAYPSAFDVERAVVETLLSKGINVRKPNHTAIDFIVATSRGDIAVELKSDLRKLGRKRVSAAIAAIENFCRQSEIGHGYLVSVSPIPDSMLSLQTERVSIIGINKFLSITEREAGAA